MTIKVVQKKLIRRRKSFQISKEDFIDFDFLGSGGFGTCCRAIFKFDNQVYCVKMINQTSKKKAAFQSFEAETKTELFAFNHPNIVKLLAATPLLPSAESTTLDNLLMTFEYVEGRNLQRLLEDDFEVMHFQRMCKFGQNIASALQYVHAKGIVHLDVKPSNIMVTLNDVCKLADFGCSQYSESDPVESDSLLTGTFAYRAPELHRGFRPTSKCDIYAIGKFSINFNQHSRVYYTLAWRLEGLKGES